MRGTTFGMWIALATCAPAGAQNLLVTPSFDGSSAGWSCTPPDRCDHSLDDVLGPTGLGSAALATGAASANSSVELGQCIAVTPSTNFDYEGWAFVESAGPTTILRMRMSWYTDPACTVFEFSEVLAVAEETGVWTRMFRNRTTPIGVASGRFHVHFLKSPNAEGVAEARVDAFYVPEPTANAGGAAALAALAWPFGRRARLRRSFASGGGGAPARKPSISSTRRAASA